MTTTLQKRCCVVMNRFNESAKYRFWVGFIITICVSFLYPFGLIYSFGIGHAWEVLRQCPNFSIFYPFVFPFVIGLIFSGIDIGGLKEKNKLFILACCLLPLAIFAVVVVCKDALKKGPPLQPENFSYASSALCNRAFAETENIRADCLQSTPTNRPIFLISYMTKMVGLAGTNTNQIVRFADFSDYTNRASYATYADLLASGYAGLMVAVLFGYLAFIRIAVSNFSKVRLDNLILALILFSIWFPCRFYSLWYENFGTLDNCGETPIILLAFAAAMSCIIATVIFKPDKVVVISSAIQTVLISITGIIANFQPDLFGQIGLRTIGKMPAIYFAAILFTLFLGLFAILWPFVTKCDSSAYSSKQPLQTNKPEPPENGS